ncbi:MAG: putative 4-hydroxybenzoate polyprenyltransferase [Planctomycetaceae bacterium]|jgi:4-hydroxybenzoate polyprenyltransferase|nr:putative 4-hydroxybenzoate polyprenyltransferase [Planctomycetaceae bacterium]
MTIRKYLELIRFSHTLFAMPFALLSAVMAWEVNRQSDPPIDFRLWDLPGILLCMFFARSTAMAFNRWADQKIDAENPRTAQRHIPAGKISSRHAALFTVFCAVGFLVGTTLFLPKNFIPLIASAPVLIFLCGYSFAKRFTILAHWWLGAALALAPIAAWIAVCPAFSVAPIFLGGAALFWTAGFDVVYSLQDEQFDRKKRLFSVPAKFGTRSALRIAAASHGIMLVFLFLIPPNYPAFGVLTWGTIALIGVILLIEHWVVNPSDPDRINFAFFWLNIVISLLLLIAGTIDVWLI